MNTPLTTRLLGAILACVTTAFLLGGIDGLAAPPATDALLSHVHTEAVRSVRAVRLDQSARAPDSCTTLPHLAISAA